MFKFVLTDVFRVKAAVFTRIGLLQSGAPTCMAQIQIGDLDFDGPAPALKLF